MSATRASVPVAPRSVNVLVTARCNLACRHCSVYGEGYIAGDVSLADWRAIFRRLSDWKVLKLTLSGGEPLAREDIVEVLETVRALPFRFSLNTNAMLVTDAIAETLARCRPRLESVMVSLDGASPATHDAIRGVGTFEAMAEGVELLRRKGVPIGFYCTVTGINVGELERIAEWGISRGGSYVKFNDLLCVGRACLDRELALDGPARRQAARRVAALADKFGPVITGTLLDMHRFAERVLAGQAPPYPQGSRGCGAMRSQMSIWPDGRVTPCDRLPHYTIGNALSEEFPAIWRSPAAERFRDMLAVPISALESCRNCKFLEFCTGGCPVIPMRKGTDLLDRDPGSCLRLFIEEGASCV